MVLGRAVNMSLMDISKIFSLLQPKEEDEDSEQCQALNNAVSSDDVALLSELLSQETFRRSINARSGWGVPVTPLRTAAAHGHLRCLELLLEHGAEVRHTETVLFWICENRRGGQNSDNRPFDQQHHVSVLFSKPERVPTFFLQVFRKRSKIRLSLLQHLMALKLH